MCEDFAANFGDKTTGCCITATHSLTLPFFTKEFFYQDQHDCRPPPTQLFSVSPIEDKSESRHIDTTVMIEAESEAVLNTLTEHDFRMNLKWQKW
jgi:hypothetical protein